MKESGYYPPGAEFDENAPYNEKEKEEKSFEVTASFSISKDMTLYSSDYYLDEDEVKTDDINWYGCFIDNERYTPLDIIESCKELAEEKLERCSEKSYEYRYLNKLIEACDDWNIDEAAISEN